MSTMKVMQYQGYGGPERIEPAEVPVPRPAASQLLVRVAATSVNPVDWKLRSGAYRWIMPVRFPSIPGFDLAGAVTEVGRDVTRFKPGDRIFAMQDVRPGAAAAEYAVVGERAAARMPANLTSPEAAAVPLAGLAALQSLRDLGRIEAGQRVLVIGAAGGVGHFAVQIAKSYGATVTGVCSGAHVAMVRRIGADRVIDYTRQPHFRGSQPYDLVLDLIVRQPLRVFLPLLTRSGIYVASLPSFGCVAAMFLLPFYSRRRVRLLAVKPRGADLDQLRELCETGKLHPVIERVFPLAELAAAHAYSQRDKTGGKIAITVRDSID